MLLNPLNNVYERHRRAYSATRFERWICHLPKNRCHLPRHIFPTLLPEHQRVNNTCLLALYARHIHQSHRFGKTTWEGVEFETRDQKRVVSWVELYFQGEIKVFVIIGLLHYNYFAFYSSNREESAFVQSKAVGVRAIFSTNLVHRV